MQFDADSPFVEPPASISMSETTRVRWKTLAEVAPGGVTACMAVLLAEGRVEQSGRLARYVLDEAEPAVQEMAAYAVCVAEGRGVCLHTLDEALERNDAAMELHRVRQTMLVAEGRAHELEPVYRARYEGDPSPENAYLLARALEPAAAVDLLARALHERPEDERLRFSMAWNLDLVGQPGLALQHYEHLDGSEDFARHAEAWTRAAVRAGQLETALALAEAEASHFEAVPLILAHGEALRGDERELAKTLEAQTAWVHLGELPRQIYAGDDSGLHHIQPREQAALLFAASRQPDLDAEERAALRARALELETLPDWVHLADAHWD